MTISELVELIDEPNRSACFVLMRKEAKRFWEAPASTHNHQAWDCGYVEHVTEAMNFGAMLYRNLYEPIGRPLGFTLSDVLLAVFLHDIEKPWKYVLGQNELDDPDLSTKERRTEFRWEVINRFGFELSEEVRNAIEYAEGEIHNYSNRQRYMGRLAAFVHCCDVLSARAYHDYPKLEGDEWEGAQSVASMDDIEHKSCAIDLDESDT